MSEYARPRLDEDMLTRLREEQNEIEEGLREDFLNVHLFHDRHFDTTDFSELLDLRMEFMREKTDKNMGERFDMALSPKYLGKIHVVELGMAEAPFESGDIASLVDDYRNLRARLIDESFIKREASREESGRNLEVRLPSEELRRDRVVIIRNRPLVESPPDSKDVKIGIAKREVFSIPSSLYYALARRTGSGRLDTEECLQVIENLLDRNDKSIDPIRTGYYLSTNQIS